MLTSRTHNLFVTIVVLIFSVFISSCGSGLKVDEGSGSSSSGSAKAPLNPPNPINPPDPMDPYEPIIPPPDTNTSVPFPILDIQRTLSVQLGVDAPFDASIHSYLTRFFISTTSSKDAPVLGHYNYPKGGTPSVDGMGSILEATLATPMYNGAVPGFGWSDDAGGDAGGDAGDVIRTMYVDSMVQYGAYSLVAARYRNGDNKPNHQYLLLLKGSSPTVMHITPKNVYRGSGQGSVREFALGVARIGTGTSTDARILSVMPPFFMTKGGYLFYGLYTNYQGSGRVVFSLYGMPLSTAGFASSTAGNLRGGAGDAGAGDAGAGDGSVIAVGDRPQSTALVLTMEVDTLPNVQINPMYARVFDPNRHIRIDDSGLVYVFNATGVEVRSISLSDASYINVVSTTGYRAAFEHTHQGSTAVYGGVLPLSVGVGRGIPAYIVADTGVLHYIEYGTQSKTLGVSTTVVGGGKYWFDHINAGNRIYLLHLKNNEQPNALSLRCVYNTAKGEFVFNAPANPIGAKFVYSLEGEVEVLADGGYALFRRGNGVFYFAPSSEGDPCGSIDVQSLMVGGDQHTVFDPQNGGSLYVFGNDGNGNTRYDLNKGLDANAGISMAQLSMDEACVMDDGFPKTMLDKHLVGYSCPTGKVYYFYDASGFSVANPMKDALYIYATMPTLATMPVK